MMRKQVTPTVGVTIDASINMHDAWVGVFWRKPKYKEEYLRLVAFVCPVPFLCIRVCVGTPKIDEDI